MPTYVFTSPDGVEYEIDGPAGSTHEEAFAKLKSSLEPQAPSIDDQRAQTSKGAKFQFGPFDTGLEMPQWLDEGLAGAGRRFNDIASLGGALYTPDSDAQADAQLNDSGAAMVGGAAADLASIAALGTGLKVAGAIPKLGGLAKAGKALTTPKTLKQIIGGGAAYGAATSEDRLAGGAGGAIGGAAGYGVPKLLAKAAKPVLQKGAQAMVNRGNKLTPGELIGGGVQRMEDSLTSVPLIGDSIKNAKARSVDGFNLSVIDEALTSVGAKLPPKAEAGRAAIAQADEIISNVYDDVLESMPVVIDEHFAAMMQKITGMVENIPFENSRKLFHADVEDALAHFQGGTALGKTFKEADSFLRKRAKKLINSANPEHTKAGQALSEVHTALLDMAKRQHPDQAAKIAGADKAYSIMSKVRQASTYAGAKDGVFTPGHLTNAIKGQGNKNQFARGKLPMQDYAEGAKGVLPQTVPDSGTPGRAAVGLLASGMVDPTLAAGALGGAGLYTKPAQALLQGLLTARPAGAAGARNALEAASPYAGLLGIGVNLQE